jgi:ParB family chromosome partitioning protein
MSNRRSALGRGLGALISNPGPATATSKTVSGDQADGSTADGVRLIPVELIDPNPEQPRRVFDPDKLESMASSILQHGVLQPVVVRRAGERFELIMGERRWRASRAAGVATIPAVVADVAAKDRLELAIVENVQRHDLNPIELAHAFRALADGGATQEQIGRKVGMDRSSIANHLRLLELSTESQADVEAGRITLGHAKALLQVTEPTDRDRLRDRVVKEGLSVRATEQLGRRIAGPARGRKPDEQRTPVALDPDLRRLVESLQHRFQAGVQLKGDGKRGCIQIEYFSREDLMRVSAILLGDLP